jgi:hypothetical protein
MYNICRSLHVILSFWSLYGLSFLDLRIQITPLVSSSSSLNSTMCAGAVSKTSDLDRLPCHLKKFLVYSLTFQTIK